MFPFNRHLGPAKKKKGGGARDDGDQGDSQELIMVNMFYQVNEAHSVTFVTVSVSYGFKT